MNLELITGDESLSEIIAIAYQMEENLGVFYRAAIKQTQDTDLTDLLEKLAGIEEKHKTDLLAMTVDEIDEASIKAEMPVHILEGGFDSQTLLDNNQAFLDSTKTCLELAMMLETQALDLYLRFAEKSTQTSARDLLYKIASEERAHLASLGRLHDQKI